MTLAILLPAGLQDDLPPQAALKRGAQEAFLTFCEHFGYDYVTPPLLEFETSLLADASEPLRRQTFRMMDPLSQQMLGLRADITPQIARIATTRLGARQRPLRLCYAGDVLRVKGHSLRPERQFVQAGFELIGTTAVAADVEVATLALAALHRVGLAQLSLDLNCPKLLDACLEHLGYTDTAAENLKAALQRKDKAALPRPLAPLFQLLLAASAPWPAAAAALSSPEWPESLRPLTSTLYAVAEAVARLLPQFAVSIDLTEQAGLGYYDGICFAVYGKGYRGEIGRGGRYLAGGSGEPACGFTAYLETIVQELPAQPQRRLLLVPADLPLSARLAFADTSWRVIAHLDPDTAIAAAARRDGMAYLDPDMKVCEP